MKKDWIMIAAIPIFFGIGIIAFFVLLPSELLTITNFIGYASSLSTVIMVLVYLFTNSQQLRIMKIQLNEMEMSRTSQIQPLPYMEKPKAKMSLTNFYIKSSNQNETRLTCRYFFEFNVKNLGNGPAVEVDFLPKIYKNTTVSIDNSKFIIDSWGKRIDCVSLREGDSKKISFLFFDDKHEVAEAFLSGSMYGSVLLKCTIVYKNSLGMAFKEEIGFAISSQTTEDDELIKTCLRVSKTVELDFGKRIKKYNELMVQGSTKEAKELFSEIRAELGKRFNGKNEIDLSIDIKNGSFSVNPISESEYLKIISEKNEIDKRIFGTDR